MKFVTPKVYVIGETKINLTKVVEYLREIGAEEWVNNYQDFEEVCDAELLTEIYGRLCYRSFGVGLNPNITRTRDGNREYLANILSSAHGSVLEHCSVNFIFHDVSRVFTHELVRHRVGTAISQESLRYVRLTELRGFLPEAFQKKDGTESYAAIKMRNVFEYLEAVQTDLALYYRDEMSKGFSFKKLLTSAFRRLAPIGMATTIGWTANLRTLRHVIPLRTSVHAEEEIRLVFHEVGVCMKRMYPNVFQDMELNEKGEWVCQNQKI